MDPHREVGDRSSPGWTALVGSCHLISCVTWGFEHLMFLSLYFLILAEMDNSSSVGVRFNEL